MTTIVEDAPIALLRPESMTSRPTVSLHLLVKNGASVVDRLFDNVGPYIDEASVVLNDTDDDTLERIVAISSRHNLVSTIRSVTASEYPDWYILDTFETYQKGTSLMGEVYEGPFTEKPILADWSAARNHGWKSDCQWKLFLDADDVVEDPVCLPGLCALLTERGHDLATAPYRYRQNQAGQVMGSTFRERLVKNVPYIKWHGKIHEYLIGSTRAVHIDGSLIVTDKKDSKGEGLRIPGRNFKILYYWARQVGWDHVSTRDLLYMGMEVKATMPDFAARALELYLALTNADSSKGEERAWAMCMRGEIDELGEHLADASYWYRLALIEHPSAKAAYRLCRASFKGGFWQKAIEAYDLGVAHEKHIQLFDDGPVFRDASKILVAESLLKLGRAPEALVFCKEALAAFPASEAVKHLHSRIVKVASVKETT